MYLPGFRGGAAVGWGDEVLGRGVVVERGAVVAVVGVDMAKLAWTVASPGSKVATMMPVRTLRQNSLTVVFLN